MFQVTRRSAMKIAALAAAASSMSQAAFAAEPSILPSWVDGDARAGCI